MSSGRSITYLESKILAPLSSAEQNYLADFTGRRFSRREAKRVWDKVLDHKWILSEHLGRDVGFRVAANDFLENFYRPETFKGNRSKRQRIPLRVFSQYDYFAGISEE